MVPRRRLFLSVSIVALEALCAGCGARADLDGSGDVGGAPSATTVMYDGSVILRPDPHGSILEMHIGSPVPACKAEVTPGPPYPGWLALVDLSPAMQHAGVVVHLDASPNELEVIVRRRPNLWITGSVAQGELRVVSITEDAVTIELSGVGVFPPPSTHSKLAIDLDGSYTALRCR